MADQLWQFKAFPAPNGEQAAVSFLNEPLRQGPGEAAATFPTGPRQAAGEATGFVRNDGSAAIFYLEPGSG